MSSTDKTREMLVNSMVKTKTGAQANEPAKSGAGSAQAGKTVAKPVTRKKTAKKKAVAKRATVKKKAIAKTVAATKPATDPFQSRGRVWPD